MIRAVLAVTAIAVGIGAALAQDPIAARRELMKSNGQALYGVINGINRGRQPYDQAKVDSALDALAEHAPKILTAFPPGSAPGPTAGSDYYTSPTVFEKKAAFDDHVKNLEQVIAQSKSKAKDPESLKAVYTQINEACDACHKDFRLKKS